MIRKMRSRNGEVEMSALWEARDTHWQLEEVAASYKRREKNPNKTQIVSSCDSLI